MDDIKIVKRNAIQAGKTIKQYLIDLGYDDTTAKYRFVMVSERKNGKIFTFINGILV